MKFLALAPAFTLATLAFVAVPTADAAHRHSSRCRHGYSERYDRHSHSHRGYARSHRSWSPAPYYYGAGPSYGYGYWSAPYPAYGYYDYGYGYYPPPRYYRHRRHPRRPHVGIYFGF